mgnify:CR=1 FL=1
MLYGERGGLENIALKNKIKKKWKFFFHLSHQMRENNKTRGKKEKKINYMKCNKNGAEVGCGWGGWGNALARQRRECLLEEMLALLVLWGRTSIELPLD